MEEFMKVLVEDAKVREEFLRQETTEGAYKVARPYIGNMSQDDFSTQIDSLKGFINKAKSGELTEDDLDAIAGGAITPDMFSKWFKVATDGISALEGIGTSIWSAVEKGKKSKNKN